MPFSFEETPESRSGTLATPATTVLRYIAAGEQDAAFVASYALVATPQSVTSPVGTLWRQDIKVDPAGFALYRVEAPYAQAKRVLGDWRFSFDTAGGVATIKAAKEHIATYPTGGDSNPHNGSIGVTKDGEVEGAEIVIPALKLSYAFKHAQGVVDEAFAKLLAAATGTTNLNTFRTFAAGELLFIGASGSDGRDAEAEVTYNFIALRNATGLTIGEIIIAAKAGHDYVWIEFQDATDDDDAACVRPVKIHVERVYDKTDFAAYFGWS